MTRNKPNLLSAIFILFFSQLISANELLVCGKMEGLPYPFSGISLVENGDEVQLKINSLQANTASHLVFNLGVTEGSQMEKLLISTTFPKTACTNNGFIFKCSAMNRLITYKNEENDNLSKSFTAAAVHLHTIDRIEEDFSGKHHHRIIHVTVDLPERRVRQEFVYPAVSTFARCYVNGKLLK